MATPATNNFAPADVIPVFPNSVFQNAEKEVIAAHVVTFLAKNGNLWNTPITGPAFMAHTREPNAEMPGFYVDPFANPFLASGCANAIHALAADGFLEWGGDGGQSLFATPKLQEFYAAYVREVQSTGMSEREGL